MSSLGCGIRTARLFASICVLLLMFGGVLLADQYDFTDWTTPKAAAVNLGLHRITFFGRTYVSATDQSTWYYRVESVGSPAISHWVLALCIPESDYVGSTPTGTLTIANPDPTTGVVGIKWDEGFDNVSSRDYSVTIYGNWAVELVTAAIKAGGQKLYGQVLGPSCTPAPEIELSVGGLAPLTIDQPLIGQWAGGGGSYIASLGDLSVSVTVSGSVSYSLFVSYGLGAGQSPLGLGFTGAPISYEYPTGSGIWFDIPEGPSGATLHGVSGTSTDSHDYPVRLNLDTLGDRQAGDLIEFLLTVTVTSN